MGKKRKPTLYDPLTGLPKFNLLEELLNDYVLLKSGKHSVNKDQLALVYLDINNFKYLNETYGYKACDEVIKCVADHLISKAKNSNYVTRVTRDKFALLLTNITSSEELYETIEEIINNGYNISSSDYAFYITMSAGVALYPKHGRDLTTLMKKAEMANYTAKKTGVDINIYSDELQKDIVEQVQMINKLQNSIDKNEFTLFFQPVFKLNTNEIIGAETLVRWMHPVNGFISPETFIPIAEKSKQIYELERLILDKALRQKEHWEQNGLAHMELSINLSSKTLESESNFQKIEKIIATHKVDYSKIIIEITETVMISQVDLAIERLNRLRDYGINIALDDFGTGYSSLTHILKLPIDFIKIDRSFIKSIPEAKEETAITQNVISLAHDLNLKVIAEGIETQEQLDYLKEISCELGQGFLLCKPLPSNLLSGVMKQEIELLSLKYY